MLSTKKVLTAASMMGVLAITSAANAGMSPDVEVTVTASNGYMQTLNPMGTPTGGMNPAEYNHMFSMGDSDFNIDFDFNADGDVDSMFGAFLGTGFTLMNNSDAKIDFTIEISLNLTGFISPTAMFGGNGQFTLTGDGGSVSALPGTSLYSAFAGGNLVHSDFAAPFSQGVPGNFGTNFGGLSQDADSLSAIFSFSLTDGEQLTHTGSIGGVPAPGALALLGIAGVAGRRRRRN